MLTCSYKVSYSLPGMTELYVAHSFITAMANIPLCLEDEKEQKIVSKEKEKVDLEFWVWFRFSQQTFILKLKILLSFLS